MASTLLHHEKESRAVLIFGSQPLDFTHETASELRAAVLKNPALEWVPEVLAELQHRWDIVTNDMPELRAFPGGELLCDLDDWLRTGSFPRGLAAFPLPNILLTPLIVITHLLQYLNFKSSGNMEHDRNCEILGLCSGLLSAVAVSSAADDLQLRKFGTVAIRLAMIIGAIVDAQNCDTDGQPIWASFSAAWASADLDNALSAVLPEFPDAYISVISDERRVTVTCRKCDVAGLQQRLNALGLTTTRLGLRGSFHSPQHAASAEALIRLCDEPQALLRFPDAAELVQTMRDDSGGYIKTGSLHRKVIRSILTEQANWKRAFAALNTPSCAASFGLERCVPTWLSRKLGTRLIHVTSLDTADGEKRLCSGICNSQHGLSDNDDAVAVVGMSCLLPGAPDLESFWDVLCAGKSQHVEVPPERFGFETAWRSLDPERKWYGNFIDDYDSFDHKFFRKSPREMASSDPQHRLMLQVAYQAVEQSGYFNDVSDRHIGCYLGVGLVDYEHNVACHPANAYTATGNLKAFTAGKISHYFGWTGPALTIDTACSSSAVAIHTACRAILAGDCSSALAGGVTIITSPEWYQNLAGASFLSSTGQCKPFDADADGYCRGEAVGAVFLKKLSTAVKDGNQILGVIAASEVHQNENCTAITVPNAPSLSGLFHNVLRRAKLEPTQVSVVEAHGTGTPVGDPAEYDSVRRVFGASNRSGRDSKMISLSSVKGLLGHSEAASGVVALIKVLLMIIKGYIPPQASFKTINPSIHITPTDSIEIPIRLKPWDVDFRAALINNYGASGSNASLVITQGPQSGSKSRATDQYSRAGSINEKYPFWLAGLDERSLRAYAIKLVGLLTSQEKASIAPTVADLSFQVSRQSNRNLAQSLIFSCSTITDLKLKLQGFIDGQKTLVATPRRTNSRPVVLCFGGQITTFVGLDRVVYESVKILRRHLDEVDGICASLGLESIYPHIFQKTPVDDIICLHAILFAMQYSCAKTWIDCGVNVAAVVGHSFGEITAMCISGILSAKDAVKLVTGRARIIRDSWGPERGAMMAVEANLKDVESLLAEVGQKEKDSKESAISIACFNGPRSFTLAGPVAIIDTVENTIKSNSAYSYIRTRKLDVLYAYHSTLVEALEPELRQLSNELIFRDPIIPLERAVAEGDKTALTADFVARHLRYPVYFSHAVQRIEQKYPEGCIWLEAGSNSTITTMASRALRSPKSSFFEPVNITSKNAFGLLVDTTTNLCQEGLDVSFWAHHVIQSPEYPILFLPPYQFEKAKHWMELKNPEKSIVEALPPIPEQSDIPQGVWTFAGYQDHGNSKARFRINSTSKEYKTYVLAHIIAEAAPICSSTYQLALVIDSLASLTGDPKCLKLKPELQIMTNHSPMVLDASKSYWIDVERGANTNAWDWKIIGESGSPPNTTVFVTGRIEFKLESEYKPEFERYERLIQRERCLELLDGDEAEGAIVGSRNIYKAFASTVQYNHERFRGLTKLACRGNKSAGRIEQTHTGDTWLDHGLADGFCQVAGLWINCMVEKPDEIMFVSDRIDQWIRAPRESDETYPTIYDVVAYHSRSSERECTSDVFVFDHQTGQLFEVILGLHYISVSRAGMAKLLTHLSGKKGVSSQPVAIQSVPLEPLETLQINGANGIHHSSAQKVTVPSSQPQEKSNKNSTRPDITGSVRDLLCNLSGLEPEEVQHNSMLADLGIDSLMGMEMASEIQNLFKCKLEMSELIDLTDFQSLVACISRTLGFDNVTAREKEDINGVDVVQPPRNNGVNGYENGVNAHTNGMNGDHTHINGAHGVIPPNSDNATISASALLDAFEDIKMSTDNFIEENGFSGYVEHVLPKSDELCIVHILDAFEQLGCSVRDAMPEQELERIQYIPRHEQFVKFIYDFLEQSGLVKLVGSRMIRTAKPSPAKSAAVLAEELVVENPIHTYDHKLTYLVGTQLADCLTGKADGVQIIFGTAEGRAIASGMYRKSPINVAWIRQMENLLRQLFLRLPQQDGPIEILELGAGTGGTTSCLLPMLAGLGIPFQYKVTDLSSSLVAGMRKRFKIYPSADFQVLDIEDPPASLVGSQHIVLATNCVHATHSILKSTKNIHRLLRPDGFMMMLEMTQTIPWIDLAYGPLEGWWLFDDGRRHALQAPEVWDQTLRAAGYKHVDWTDGALPEAAIQRIIIATASSIGIDPSGNKQVRRDYFPRPPRLSADQVMRQAIVDAFVAKHVQDLRIPAPISSASNVDTNTEVDRGHCVLVTGGTGSLGSHLVAHLASQPQVQRVICVNRRSISAEGGSRQLAALAARGLQLTASALAKVTILASDTSKDRLGLAEHEYAALTASVTHIVHNAWPMSLTRGTEAFEPQFRAMRNLIQLAAECSSTRVRRQGSRKGNKKTSSTDEEGKIGFLFVSSVATAGYYPLWSGKARVPEEPMGIESVLPSGYGEAKLVCEKMLGETLHKFPASFRPMVVRIGQIAGSTTTALWNPVEHFAFLIKSAQTVRALPDFLGTLSWYPVDHVAAALGDLLLSTEPAYPVYHIENPSRQPWQEMISILADELGVPGENIIPFSAWLQRVEEHHGPAKHNPALGLVDFLRQHFVRMSCGELVLDTAKSREHSETLRNSRPVSPDLVTRYIRVWKDMEFLNA
ncbi:hypothetical protein F4806DRAFT_501676 [Annulohypoxylon nitens]|nr:hypothetical protein F4806DRAFT_501676 [Annulohypoxylon nitens]